MSDNIEVIMRQMKDSGIAWVGEIPQEWGMQPIRSIIVDRIGGCWGEEVDEENQGEICLRIADFDFNSGRFQNKSVNELTKRFYSFAQIKRCQLKKGDILVEKSGGGEKTPVGRCVLFDKDYKALFANFMDRLRINEKIVVSEYVEYWLRGWYFCKSSPFYINQTTGLQNIDLTLMLAAEKICFPTFDCQKNIINFLDKECEKIDELKAVIQAQIDTLEQYKRSVITEAVTHGLNPFATMKDSEIWYNKIPQNWEVKKGKYIFTQRNDRGNNIKLQLLSPTQKYGVIPQEMYEELTGMSAVKLNDKTNYALLKTIHRGDYCISLRSFQGGFEYSEYEGVVSPAYQVFYPIIKIDREYYKYLFKERGFIEVMNSYTMSLRDGKNIAFDDFGNTFIPVPPFDEQKAIAEYLDHMCAEIEQTIADKKVQLDTLDEYRKSLIYEYVTGKKEAV